MHSDVGRSVFCVGDVLPRAIPSAVSTIDSERAGLHNVATPDTPQVGTGATSCASLKHSRMHKTGDGMFPPHDRT